MAIDGQEVELGEGPCGLRPLLEDLAVLSRALDQRPDDTISVPSGALRSEDVADLRTRAILAAAVGAYRLAVGDAEALFARALAVAEDGLGPVHPTVAAVLRERAAYLAAEGRAVEATALYRRAVTVLRATVGPDHPDVASTLHDLALLCDVEGRTDEARSLWAEARTALRHRTA
jgi:Flp pilus assembly protein TadD